MKLRILSIGYPLAPVGPDSVGGAEQVLAHIDRALVAAGHESIVVAPEASHVAGSLVPIPSFAGTLTEDVKGRAHEFTRAAIAQVLREEHVDLVHMHGIDFFEYLPETNVPVLATLHLPPAWYPSEIFTYGGNLLLHCVSAAQQRACVESGNLLPVIANGVDIPAVRAVAKEDHAVSLGRICPEKGFHLAADACARAGVGYLLAGALYGYEAHQKYFERELKPRLDGLSRKFIGPVGGEQKNDLLASAKCVLVPSLVPETSSLVTMEALAAGTPVVAFRSGALPELVDHGRTGFLVSDAAEMSKAIVETSDISPEECRKYARDQFSSERMTSEYLALYSRLAPSRVAGRGAATRVAVSERMPSAGWRAIFEDSSASPFQSPDWLEPWWNAFGTGDPMILSAGNAGVLPLYTYGGTMRFIGAGTTDYLDVVARRGREAEVAQACADYLAASLGVKKCDLDEVPPTSPLLAVRMPDAVECTVQDSSVCPVLDLMEWVPATKLAKNLRYSARRLAGEFETLPAPRATEFLDELIRSHESRWDGGIFRDPKVEAFHRESLPRLAEAGLARMHVLRTNARVLATLYCLARNGTTYYYIGGFDMQYEGYSPGSLLIEYAIRYAIAEGHHTFDFLRGAEPYKYGWGAKDRVNKRLIIASRDTAA
jgi:glycosyltransferase involved in cell wall biosynthesis/CelD/BcsL family acetyltransferase involved in cellulose biosynthesis